MVDRVINVLLVISVAMNIMLARQVVATSQKYDALLGSVAFNVGSIAPSFTAKRLDGTPVDIPMSQDKPVLLYVISPTCLACEQNEPKIASVVEQLGQRVDVFFVSVGGDLLQDATIQVPNAVTLLRDPDAATVKNYKLGSTPHTIFLRSGRIEGAWVGTFVSGNARQLSAMLNVTLADN